MCWHRWSDWAIKETGILAAPVSKHRWGTYIVQERFCRKCGKTAISEQKTCRATGMQMVPDQKRMARQPQKDLA